MSLLATLNTAARSLSAQTKVVEVVQHNVANANTPSYHRQEAVLKAGTPYGDIRFISSTGEGQMGTGVVVEQIKRFNLQFFDGRYRLELGASKQWEAYQGVLQQVEAILAETSQDGLTNKLDAFWSGWQLLNSDPSSLALRADLRDRAVALTNAFSRRAEQLQNSRADLDLTIKDRVEEINSIARQLAELNQEIPRVRALDNEPNDLLDERDRLLDRLSEISGQQAFDQENGENIVSIGGHALVVGTQTFELVTTPDAANENLLRIDWADGQPFTATTGELRGYLDARDQAITDQLDGLNQLAQVLNDQVNALHQIGYNMANPAVPSGIDFFTIDDATHQALTIHISVDIKNDLENIAAAETADSAPGDGNMARQISDLQVAQFVIGGDTTTMNQFYTGKIGTLALETQRAERNFKDLGTIVRSLSDQREAVNGVNLDEEATNLMQSQKAYNAAARVLTAIDDMIDRIINSTGRVGL
ncbi:MAG: flagellar hook-associated protein FlgK [Anaerolineales bacterium]|jgi:flagellar hook-associated protein 1 FlgK|nr:flagellar hook-associated protein FlgK [Anaerolineales bacterium]